MDTLKEQKAGRTALSEYTPREFIAVVSYPKSSKHDTILSLAAAWQRLSPDGKVYILDTEGRREPELANIYYRYCQDIDAVILSLGEITKQLSPRDWLCVESLARIWEFSENKESYIHDFRNVLVKLNCNILTVTTLRKEQGIRKGTLGPSPDGDPMSLYLPDTVLLMTKEADGLWCTVLKDRGSEKPKSIRFHIENWYLDFMTNCR